jgi:hypothetical protein
MAMGILVVPIDILFKNSGAPVKIEPMATPAAIAIKIHKVR